MDQLQSGPYQQAMLLWGLSKCREEPFAKEALVKGMEYLVVIDVTIMDLLVEVNGKADQAIEGLDQSVVDLETRVQ